MLKKLFLSSYFLVIAILGFSQQELPVGEKAPVIQFQKSFPAGYKIPTNKPIVLDFWATWCGPCVAGLIENNELVDKYANRIEFIAITDTTSRKVEEFIKSKNFKHNFIIDKDTQTFNAFGVSGIPHAFIIDDSGTIQWSGYGRDINEQLLNEFLLNGRITEKQASSMQFSYNDTAVASKVLNLVITNQKLLESHKTVLKAKVADKLGKFSNSPTREGKLTVINYTLQELTERINPFFSNLKLQVGDAGSIGYDFISLPFDSFESLNRYLKKYYGIYFK